MLTSIVNNDLTLSKAIIGIIIHSCLVYLLVKGRQEAIIENSRRTLGTIT